MLKTSLNQILFIIKDTLQSMAIGKNALWGILVIPLVFAAFFSYGLQFIFTGGVFVEGFPVGIYQRDHHPMAHFLVDQIQRDEELGALIEVHVVHSEEELETMVGDGRLFAGVVIPEDYVGSLERGENREMVLYTNPSDPLKNHLLQGVMESFMYSVSAGQSGVNAVWNYYREEGYSLEERREMIQPVIQDLTVRALQARDGMIESQRIEGVNSLSPNVYYLHAMMVAMALFFAVYSGKNLIDERERGILRRVGISPVPLHRYELGRSMGSTLGISVFAIMFFLVSGRFGDQTYAGSFLSGVWYSLFLFGLLQIIPLIAYGIRDSALFAQWGNIGVFAAVLFGGGIIPFYYIPEQAAWISRLFPFYYYFAGLERIFFLTEDAVLPSFLMLAGVNLLLAVLKSVMVERLDRNVVAGKEGLHGIL